MQFQQSTTVTRVGTVHRFHKAKVIRNGRNAWK